MRGPHDDDIEKEQDTPSDHARERLKQMREQRIPQGDSNNDVDEEEDGGNADDTKRSEP
jgi:hypothetical protein